MTEVLVFPDAEELVCTWLSGQYADRGASTKAATGVPNPRPTQFVTVLLSGGVSGAALVLGWRTLTFDCWAIREFDAAALAELTFGLVSSLPRQDDPGFTVYAAQMFAAPANLPDPISSTPRYRFSASLLLRGTAA